MCVSVCVCVCVCTYTFFPFCVLSLLSYICYMKQIVGPSSKMNYCDQIPALLEGSVFRIIAVSSRPQN